MKLPRRSAAMVACLVAVLPAGGCYQGFTGTVNAQPPSGNGTYLSEKGISVQNAVVVAGAESGEAALSFTMVNTTKAADTLTSITVADPAKTTLKEPIKLPGTTVIAVGGPNEHQIDLTGLKAPTGSYTDVVFHFQRVGDLGGAVLVVPGTGPYANYTPKAEKK